MKRTSEQAFETAIEDILLASGFQPHKSKDFDQENAIFPQVAIDFIQTTQPKIWEKLATLHGDKTADRVITALCQIPVGFWPSTRVTVH